jgi:hypothetical protein
MPKVLLQHSVPQPRKFLYPAHVWPPFLLPHLPFLLTGAAVGAGLAEDVAAELGRTTVAIVDDATGVGVGVTTADDEVVGWAAWEVWLTATAVDAGAERVTGGATLG